MAETREYVLGTHDAELGRLGLQHRIWSEQAFACWERAGFTPGGRVLDVGCGPGYATLDLARLIGDSGRVVAVDESTRFLEHLNQVKGTLGLTNIETHLCDVQKLESLESAGVRPQSIDAANARWVLCFVADPAAVVRGVARLLRPGGVFAVQDYFAYTSLALAPRSAVFERVIAAVARNWRDRGGDPDFVGHLPRMMSQAGLEVRDIRPLVRVARPGSLLWQWPATFFSNFVPMLVQNGYLTPKDQREFEEDWAARSADPNTFFFTPPIFEVVGVKR